jgi:hypothetical protein
VLDHGFTQNIENAAKVMGWHGEVQLCIIKQKQNTFLGKYRTFSLITMHKHISVAQEAATLIVPS